MMQRVKIKKKKTVHNPKQILEKSNIKEGSEVLIETQDNEFIIHPIVSDTIKEESALFGKETLDSCELKMFAETTRVISKV